MAKPIRVLIAYDGSDPSSAALRRAVALMPGAEFTVLVVHSKPVTLDQAGAARLALPGALVRDGVAALEQEILTAGQALADAGVALVASEGANAVAETVATSGSTWRAILEEAARLECDVIACGTRGLGGFSRAALGSTSSALVHHADRPVLILPE